MPTPFPVALLLTRAHGAGVLEILTMERRILGVQDVVTDLRADQATIRATARATEMAEHTATIASLTPKVAAMTVGTLEHTLNARLLRTVSHRLENLVATPLVAANPVAAFLKVVDARQVEVQLVELDDAIAQVTAHIATLPA